MKKLLFLFLTGIIFICLCPVAGAYVLRGPHILELMTKKLGKAKGLLVSQKLVLYDDSQQRIESELTETLRYVFPEKFRSDILSERVKRIHILSKGDALTVIDEKTVDDSENRYNHYKDILLFRSRDLLQSRLSSLGVDTSISSLGRFQDKVSYVIGAQYPNDSVSQIWLDRNTFQPFRWIMRSNTTKISGERLEVRYFRWQKVDKTWYPMRIQFFQNNGLIREIMVQNIVMNPSFSDTLFDIQHLRSIYPPVADVPADQGKKEEMDEVQKTIEDFKKIYE
jgi:outer membrane lipoprotein-sorting protein